MNIVFVGVGNMGGPMAVNINAAGYQLVAVDLLESHLEPLAKQGITTSTDLSEVVAEANVVITMLPSDAAVKHVCCEQILPKIKSGSLIIDCSTVSAACEAEVADMAESKGVSFVDAPVSGGTAGAAAGTLSFLVGGSIAAFDRAKPILSHMGKNIFHAGGTGAGQIAKLANNRLLAVQMAATAEAISFGVDNGLDPAVLSEIMKASSGNNWCLQLYNPWPGVMESSPANRNYTGGFMVQLMQKDLGLAKQQAIASDSSTPFGDLAQELYQTMDSELNSDFTVITRYFTEQ